MTAEATYVSLLSAGEIRKLIHQSIDENMPLTFTVRNKKGHQTLEAQFKVFVTKQLAVGVVLDSTTPIAVIFFTEDDSDARKPLVMTSHVSRATPASPK